MKILFVSDTYYPHINGVYIFIQRLAPLLQQEGHEVAVIAPSASFRQTESTIDGLTVYGMPTIPSLLYPGLRIPLPVGLTHQLKTIQAAFAPDIIHVQDHFTIAKAVIQLNKEGGAPIIGTNHFMPENLTALVRRESWKKKIEAWCWKSFSKVYNQLPLVTTPTETGAALIRPRLHAKVMALSSGIDLDQFNVLPADDVIRTRYTIPEKPMVLFVGRLDPEKHIGELIQAVAIVRRLMDCCLVIAGKGIERQELGELALSLGVAGNIIFTGYVPEEDLPLLYKAADVFAIASTAELLSLATLQAMACGLPVVAVAAGALPELVTQDINGLLFEPHQVDGLAECLLTLISNDTMREEMGRASLRKAASHDINKTVRGFERLYEHYSGIHRLYPNRQAKVPHDLAT